MCRLRKGSGRSSAFKIQEKILRRLFGEEKKGMERMGRKSLEADDGRHGR